MTLKERLVILLRKSEKITKTDMVYVTKNGGWLLFGTILQGFLSLILAVAFANLLPKVAYGIYQYALSIAAIAAIPTLAGINTAVTYATAQQKGGVIFSGAKKKFLWGLFGSLISFIIALYYFFAGNSLLGTIFIIVALLVPASEAFSVYVSFLQGKKDFKRITLFETSAQMVATIALIVVLFISDNPLIIVSVYFLSWMVMRSILFWRVTKLYDLKPIENPEMISYGKHLSLMGVISTISSNIDKLLLWHFIGPVEVATYTFALTIPYKVNGFTKIVNRIAFPKIAERDDDSTDLFLLHKIIKMCALLAVMFVAYALLVPYVFTIFFPKYLESIPFAQLAGLLIILQPTTIILTHFSARAKKKELYIFNLASPFIKAILFISLIPFFNIFGAVLALIGSKIADTATLFILFKKSQKNRTSL